MLFCSIIQYLTCFCLVGSLPETFYAVATLWELGEVNQVDKEGACSLASESLTKGRMNMQNSFFAAETTKLLG